MYDFEFKRPSTIAEAVAALGAEEAQALGGGQTLIPTLKQRLASPAVLVSLNGIAEMKGVCVDDAGRVCIGGGT
ncbi:MAG: FAD binding domain-containing protein, partial [Paracoccaceae bacterium]|nr:FAD binding domain-containing protein [Paracoccaceae bacterium]